MDRNLRNAVILNLILGIPIIILQAGGYSEILQNIVDYLNYVTPVIDTIISFFRPLLEHVGIYLAGIVQNLLSMFPENDYTYYIAISMGIIFIAFALAVKYPGYDDKKKKD
ncbi:MAG: hypothetical protein GF364_12460 [Candidatus Lokiarchaeota archaeon]|nr:hypothetical protein [Candidatus Lokiarchaeota archaeon]